MNTLPPSTLGKRLQQLMTEHGLSDNELSRRSGVPQPSIHRLVNDKTKSPKYDNVAKIARTLGVSADYLMHGVVKDTAMPNVSGVAVGASAGLAAMGASSFLTACLGGPVIQALKALAPTKQSLPPPVYLYPELSWLEVNHLTALSDPEFVSQKNCAYSGAEAVGHGFWLAMKGDAMAAPMGQTPSLPEGVKVLFDTDRRIKPNMLVLARLPSSTSLTCRLLVEEAGIRLLKPLNPAYPMTEVTDETLLVASALEVRAAL